MNDRTGEVYYRVRYRKSDGRDRALSFYGDSDDPAEAEKQALSDAEEFARLVHTLKGDKAVEWWNRHLDRDPGDRGMSLDEWWPRYLRSRTGITEGTRDAYDRIYKRVWRTPLGFLPLTAIGHEEVAAVINQLARDGRKDKTIANAYGVLTSCLKAALTAGHIGALPTSDIRLPRNTEHLSEEMRFLSREEWEAVHGKLPEHYRPLFSFLAGSGARWGEAEALEVRDIFQGPVRLDDGETIRVWNVRINKAAKWNVSSRNREVGPTKTKKSRRTIPLGPEVMVELAPLLGGRGKTERLFRAARGGPLDHKVVWDVWVKACQEAELEDPRPRIHDLRHTHATWLLDDGVPVHIVSARLGHESIQTTVDIYGHGSAGAHWSAAVAASLAMRPRAKELGQ